MAKISFFILLVAAAAFTGCATVPRAQKSQALVLTDASYGPVVFGQSLSTLEEAIGERPYVLQDQGSCKMVGFMKIPQVQFMIEDGVVTRADSVPGSKVVTDSGVRIGSTFEKVTKKIPGLKISKHKYFEDGHYLTELSRNEKSAVIFEEVDGKIDQIRAGLMPSVGYLDKCL